MTLETVYDAISHKFVHSGLQESALAEFRCHSAISTDLAARPCLRTFRSQSWNTSTGKVIPTIT